MDKKEDLKNEFYKMPQHSDLLEYWKKNKEVDPIRKALRFLFLSNLTWGKSFSIISGVPSIEPWSYTNTSNGFYPAF